MSREEQITNEAQIYSAKELENTWDRPTWEDIKFAFEAGANWADANPAWHKYPDEKPPKSGVYLACCGASCGAKQLVDIFDIISGEWISGYDKFIRAWMELPKLPKFD